MAIFYQPKDNNCFHHINQQKQICLQTGSSVMGPTVKNWALCDYFATLKAICQVLGPSLKTVMQTSGTATQNSTNVPLYPFLKLTLKSWTGQECVPLKPCF